jgi:hypothetical protein
MKERTFLSSALMFLMLAVVATYFSFQLLLHPTPDFGPAALRLVGVLVASSFLLAGITTVFRRPTRPNRHAHS